MKVAKTLSAAMQTLGHFQKVNVSRATGRHLVVLIPSWLVATDHLAKERR